MRRTSLLLRVSNLVSILALVMGAACGGGTGKAGDASANGAPASAAQENDLCQAQCDWSMRCGFAAGGPTCVSSCVAMGGNPAAYRSDVIGALTGCYPDVACSAGTSACIEQALTAVEPQWSEDTRFTTCTAKSQQCKAASPPGFSSDLCVYTISTTDAVRAQVATCLAGDCAAVEACIRTALGLPAR